MAGLLNIPKLVDYRNKVKRHPTLKFPVRKLSQKNTIAIHHSLTKQGLGGSNAESYARFHVDSHGWPSIGYSYVIEPDGTIKFCNDIELRTYHVGNHNDYAIGICLTGDFRYEEPTEAQKQSLRNLVNGLKKEYPHIKYVKGHNEFSGYEWKQCPVFDYKAVLSEKGTVQKPKELPSTYVIQQGDTFWSIAKGLDNITVDDLIKANPNIDHTKLKVGQKINLGKNVTEKPKKEVKPKQSNPKSNSIKVGSKVVLSKSASKYATGETIPSYIKGKTYTVMQLKSDRALLEEIMSWVYLKDIGGNSSSPSQSKPKSTPKATKEYVELPASAKTWRTYKLNVQPIAKNSDWSLTPSAFGGLTYEVLGEPYPHVVTINTSRGKRNIYVAPSTSAKRYKK